MRFDEAYFDQGIDRVGTRCEKWDGSRKEHGEGIVPLWVADMDFLSPPAVQEALIRRAQHGTYGYTELLDDDYEALTSFWQRRHGLTVTKEDVMLLPCVITGMRVAINALTQPGDGVIIQSPVYGPFRFSVEATGRKLLDAPLIRREDGRYDMDLAAVEEHLKNGASLMLLCSPHNPVSRAWTRQELSDLLALLKRYDVPLVSDEIHADFVFAPQQFVPVLSVEQENVVSLCAPSKTFNLAGLQQASCLCVDEQVRKALQAQIEASGVRSGNLFALEATRAAYNEGDAWLDGLMAYLDGNRRRLTELVKTLLPKAVLTPLEATYLGWLDLRAYGYTTEELMQRSIAAGVQFTGGTFFGDLGEGFLRVNIGCPRRSIEEGIKRLARALA
ncbi:MAG: pyridoxal phosphate-dependent aminotransferase [Christensenellaceae bacterium]|nr:pyridoxal phosphate-dependent aminotransferase [Christensenellaceae bacterium]